MSIEHVDFDGTERLALVLGGDIVSTFDDPGTVKLGHCKVIEEIMIGEDKLSPGGGWGGGGGGAVWEGVGFARDRLSDVSFPCQLLLSVPDCSTIAHRITIQVVHHQAGHTASHTAIRHCRGAKLESLLGSL
jgi:hypothetical protein